MLFLHASGRNGLNELMEEMDKKPVNSDYEITLLPFI